MQGAMEEHKSGFVRHVKPAKSGSGTNLKKAYYLADALQFTVPYIRALGKPSGNLSQPPSEEEEGPALEDGVNDDDDFLTETPLPSPTSLPPPTSKSSSCTSSVASTLPQRQNHQSEPINERIPNKRKRTYDDVDKAFMEYLDQKKASSSAKREQLATDPRGEALKMLILSFIPDPMKMDEEEVRQFKKKTLDAVDDIMPARSRSTHSPSSSWLSLSNDSFSKQMPPPSSNTLEGYNIQEGDSFLPLAAYYLKAFKQNTV